MVQQGAQLVHFYLGTYLYNCIVNWTDVQLVLKKLHIMLTCLHGQIEQKVIEVHPRNFDHCTDQKCILTFFHIFIIAIFLITLIFKLLYYLSKHLLHFCTLC